MEARAARTTKDTKFVLFRGLHKILIGRENQLERIWQTVNFQGQIAGRLAVNLKRNLCITFNDHLLNFHITHRFAPKMSFSDNSIKIMDKTLKIGGFEQA